MKKMVVFMLSIVLVISSISLVIAKPKAYYRKTTKSTQVVSKRNSQAEAKIIRITDVKYTKFAGRMRARGREIKFDVPPVIKSGTTLIPVRAVVESLGANVNWDAASNTVTITKDDKTVVFDLNNSKVYVNGAEVTIDMPPMKISSRMFVPLRFIAENLGIKINYDNKTGDIDIEDDDAQNSTVSQDVYDSDNTVINSVYGQD